MPRDLRSELEETLKAYSDFLNKLFNVSTYFRGLTWDELRDSLAMLLIAFVRAWQLSSEYLYKFSQRMFAADLDGALDTYLEYLSKMEDIAGELANTPLYAAHVNAANRLYMSYLTTIQSINSAILHSLGLVTRKDVVALGEAYVDLKGDLKREAKRIRDEVAKLHEGIEEYLRREVKKLRDEVAKLKDEVAALRGAR